MIKHLKLLVSVNSIDSIIILLRKTNFEQTLSTEQTEIMQA